MEANWGGERVLRPTSPTSQTLPPWPPSPPEGPPRGTNCARRNATTPLPPRPPRTWMAASSRKIKAAGGCGEAPDRDGGVRPGGTGASLLRGGAVGGGGAFGGGRARGGRRGRAGCRQHVHEGAAPPTVLELHDPALLGEEGVVLAAADVGA